MRDDKQDCTIASLIDTAIEREESAKPQRSHLGASSIGQACERKVWLEFRWAIPKAFAGRILRLFRRGQNEEATVVADLRAAGYTVNTVDPATGRQYAFKDGHFAGSCDGIITDGPGLTAPALLEVKTHNLGSFGTVAKDGVSKAHPAHYHQMQVYMAAFGLTQALYFAVNKNDDAIYTEWVQFDSAKAAHLQSKAQRIIADTSPPPPISVNPTWYKCKMCSAHDLCHGSKTSTQVNCRTCKHSTPHPDGTWHCSHWQLTIPSVQAQIDGCPSHVMHPDLTAQGHHKG